MRKLGVGFIGCGRILDLNILGYLERDDVEIAAFCDVSRETLDSRVGRYGDARTYTDYTRMLEDPGVDIVEVLTPHHLHHRMVLDSLAAGKHVSLQKPPAVSIGEMESICEAAQKASTKFKVYENFIFYPPYVRARELFRAGEIGDPVSLRIKMCSSLSPSGWEVPMEAWAWRVTEELCGGGPCLFDDGYHKWSVAIDLLGEVEKVFAWVGEKPILAGINVDAPGVVAWKYAGEKDVFGVCDEMICNELQIDSNYYAIDERMELTGEKGVIWVMKWTADLLRVPPLMVYRDGKLTKYDDMPHDWGDSFKASTCHFIDCIRNDTEPILGCEKGSEVLKFALAMMRSAEEGREVYLDEF